MVKLTNAIQSGGQYENLTATLTPIPGIAIPIRAHTAVYLDFRVFINAPATVGFTIRINGWTPSFLYPMPIFDLNNFLDQQLYMNASRPDPQQWTPFTAISYFGELHAFGTIANDTDDDDIVTVSLACVTPNGITPVVAIGARMSILEDSQVNPPNQNNNITDMTQCGCCVTATISCCQTAITINTINPDTDFTWKIIDFIGGVYTGTMTTDAEGVGTITVGDGMDLPDGFLDAIGTFKIEFVDNRPAIASKMDCIEVDIVGGAYLALTDIGEPLP
jgi:hypothetical protein